MRGAVILLWAGCLWLMFQDVLYLILAASPWRKLAVLAVMALAASSCHQPHAKP